MLEFLKRLFGSSSAQQTKKTQTLQEALVGQRHAETGLRHSEEHFDQLVAGVRDYAIFLLDREGYVRTWNAGAERIKGYRAEEIIGQHFSRFYPKESVTSGWPAHELTVASATGRFEDESWRIRKDGSRFWANVVITTLRDDPGEVRGFLKITRDLTDRKQAEEKLRMSEERFRLMVESVKDYAIFMLDPQGHISTWNAGAQRIKGYTVEEIIGQHFSKFYPPEVAKRGWPEEELRLATANGRIEDEGWRVRKDGSMFWANVVITALRDETGALKGFGKVTRDLTERRQAEEQTRRLLQEEAARKAAEEAAQEIERQRQQLHVTLASIGDAVIVTDRLGKVTFLNPVAESLTGWEQREAQGQTLEQVFQIVNEETRQVVENPVAKIFREGKVIGLANHTALIARDGREVPIEDSAAPIGNDGDIHGAVLVFRDVTETRRAREARLRLAAEHLAEQQQIQAALRESEERLAAELEATKRLHALSTRLLAAVDLRGALEDVLQEAILASRADSGDIRLHNSQSQTLEIVVQQGLKEAFLDRFRTVPLDAGVCCTQALQTGDRILVEDVEAASASASQREMLAAAGSRSMQSTPLQSRSGTTIGILSTYFRQPHRPSARDLRLLDLYAQHAADLIDRLGFEDALRHSEAQFRQLADAMPQIVWTAGADGIIDYSNARWNEFTGSTVGIGNEGWGPIVHPDDMPQAARQWKESLRTSTPFEMEIRLLDRRRGGYRWHLMRTAPVYNEAGVAIRWYGTATDIDEQKRASETAHFLAEASTALATIVDYESTLRNVAGLAVPYFADWAAVDIVIEAGSLHRLAVAHQNPERLQLAQELFERYPPQPDAPGGIGAVVRTGRPEILEELTDAMIVQGARDEEHLRLMRALHLRSYICVPLVVSGKTLGVLTFAMAESGRKYGRADLSLAEDLSRRAAVAIENANLYRAMQDEDRRKTEFLALLAHELRNPLAPLRNGLQVISLAPDDRQSVEQARTMMERQLHHLIRLVDDLLDVSRISRGKIELRKERVNLATIVESTQESCAPMLKQRNDKLIVTLPREPIYVDADKTRLAQALSNLVNNAIKYSDRGSSIWLTVEREGDQAILRVKDQGEGIPPPMLSKIFDLFTQVDRTLEKSQGGLGVGLSIVKRLIELHGGSVAAQSEGYGTGSEFILRLPVAVSLAEKQQGTSIAQPVALSSRRILVVDDNVDAASSLAMMLRLLGNEVRTAHDGIEALSAAEEFRPELILLDIGMPKLNGYDTCRRIREREWGKKAVIVALTGWGQEEDKRRSEEAGFNTHLVKPVEPATLDKLLTELAVQSG